MHKKGLFIFVAGFILAGCQSVPEDLQSDAAGESRPGDRAYAEMIRDTKPPAGPLHEVREGVLTPIEAVVYASRVAPDGFPGTFGMEVRNFGYLENGVLFLNSELNFREQTSVSARIQPQVAEYLQRRHGDDWLDQIVGKDIEVEGVALRQTIWFNDSVRGRTNSYYYQTHIDVTHPHQITIL